MNLNNDRRMRERPRFCDSIDRIVKFKSKNRSFPVHNSCHTVSNRRRNAMKTSSTTMHKATSGEYASEEERWNAVVHRDAKADGRFYYSVKTTGVYCRPSCARGGAAEECCVSRFVRGGRTSGISRVPALPAQWPGVGRSLRHESRSGVSPHGNGGTTPELGGFGASRGDEQVPLSSRIQENHGPDAESICQGSSRGACARNSPHATR